MSSVEEIVDPLVMFVFFIDVSLTLGYFVFMMWESEVDATHMDIDRMSQNVSRHRGAFNMPTRSAFSPW